MSTDSTELTFVRCPSCRSLVPAVSARCRMCGASLDAAEAGEGEGEGEGEEEGASSASGRVRQRTMSKPKSELSDAAQRIRQEMVTEEPASEASSSAEDIAPPAQTNGAADVVEDEDELLADDLEDPLGDYIEEVAEPSEEPAAVKGSRAAQPEPKIEPEPVEARVEEPPAKKKGKSAAKAVEPPPAEEPIPEPTEPPLEKEPPKVIVESGSKRGKKKSSSPSFSKQEEPAPEVESEKEEVPVVAKEEQTAKTRKRPPSAKGRPEGGVVEEAPRPAHAAGARKAGGVQGRLFGWLVSYADPDGAAIELREGKFFITGSSLKNSDLVIEDESVSTPHAMVSVNVDNGVRIQDLMSDRGIFIRKRDADAYQREEEVMVAEHGDWIRFGDVEFLVSLIAHVGVK